MYAIANTLAENTVYVGSTRQKPFTQRWEHHRWALRAGCHGNRYLQRAWNKYGADAFEFVVLEIVEDSQSVHNREHHWLDNYRESGSVYNLVLVPEKGPWYGKHLSKAHRQKIGKGLRGKHHSQKRRDAQGKSRRGKSLHNANSRAKITLANMGNHNHALPYPAFFNMLTGETIPAGTNLARMCREKGLSRAGLSLVKNGSRKCHMQWTLLAK